MGPQGPFSFSEAARGTNLHHPQAVTPAQAGAHLPHSASHLGCFAK